VSKSVFIIAGEASGDLHGCNLVISLKNRNSKIKFFGIGGEKMKKAGVQLIASANDMAVVGFTEIFARLANILKAAIKIKYMLKKIKPDLLILIDYPDFNLYMAGYAKKLGIPVMYYISPQVWAWRRGRVKKIRKRVDRMVVILPFEKEFYKKVGITVDYVGHPIMDWIPKDLDKNELKYFFDARTAFPILGILPGSRKEEIKNILPIMVDTLKLLNKRYKNIKAYLPLADTLNKRYVNMFIQDLPFLKIIPSKDIYKMLSICDLAFVTSGTATLETAIMEIPMVVVYKGSYISFYIAKTLVNVPYISLVNLIAGENLVPELVQDKLTVENLTKMALNILEDEFIKYKIIQGLKRIKNFLGKGGVSERVAQIAIEMMR